MVQCAMTPSYRLRSTFSSSVHLRRLSGSVSITDAVSETVPKVDACSRAARQAQQRIQSVPNGNTKGDSKASNR